MVRKETIQSGSAFSAHPSVTLNMPQKCPASPFDAMRLFFEARGLQDSTQVGCGVRAIAHAI
jgi:hypothetical protein